MIVEHYKGSLDFPCDICKTHSYNNYHFTLNDTSELMVLCKECMIKIINNDKSMFSGVKGN